MTHKEIEAYRKELTEIINRPPQPDGNPAKGTKEDLRKLARKVGASTRAVYIHPTKTRPLGYEAGISDLIDNINDALRTEAMVDACKTAAKDSIIAIIASGVAVVGIILTAIAAIAALLSALAAWIAICK